METQKILALEEVRLFHPACQVHTWVDSGKKGLNLQPRLAGLIEERTRHFIVDPKDTLIRILKGTTSLPQLNVAWKTFQK